MSEENQYEKLQQKIAELQKRQDSIQTELAQIRGEVQKMHSGLEVSGHSKQESEPEMKLEEKVKPVATETGNKVLPDLKLKADLERFIGENLINKIGIAVIVTGVGIGAKYAIDHRLISPVTRIILGYIVGLGLLFFALRLKKNYENFSAVLISGSMAIMYFISYAAYSFYSLYPQSVTFILMVIFTILTVAAALRYDREIIAVMGMVGGFAIPFLLREGNENIIIFFSYVTIINTGILVLAFRKYWKSLYFTSFVFTWLIFFRWFSGSYRPEKDFAFAMVFLLIFYLIFYLTFLSYKLIRKEKFIFFDILLLLADSFIFYGVGYYILNSLEETKHLIGAFTLGNALIHGLVSLAVLSNKPGDRNLYYFISGLAIVFVTIAVPVQLNGNWVTLLWVCEASALFCIGRIRKATVYEYLSYILLLISFLSLVEDWSRFLIGARKITESSGYTPVLNVQFLSSQIYIIAFAIILFVFFSRRYSTRLTRRNETQDLLHYSLIFLFILVLYLAYRIEISAYYSHLLAGAERPGMAGNISDDSSGTNIYSFRRIWLCNYSMLFLAGLALINTVRIKDRLLGRVVFWISLSMLLLFLVQSLYIFSELRERYINGTPSSDFPVTGMFIAVRYISILFAALVIVSVRYWISKEALPDFYLIIFSLFFHLSLLWVLCSEMLNIMDLLKNNHSYKFGLSIVAGIYALVLIILGIGGNRKYLRIAAMVLLGVTLAKLFFYDITRLDTVMKTILFLVLGILMLLVSFLYTRYKDRLFGEEISK